MFTIDPLLAAAIGTPNAWRELKVPTRLTSSV
jgi:hypothetical protein